MLDADRGGGERLPMPRVVGPGRRSRADAGRILLRRVPAQVRVALFTLLLITLAVVLYLAFLRGQAPVQPPVVVPWYFMAGAFFAAELKVVDVHFRREKHSFSLSEFPAVIGYFLLTPTDYFLAMLQPDEMHEAHVNLIRHGRLVCHSRNPVHDRCPLRHRCRFYDPKAP